MHPSTSPSFSLEPTTETNTPTTSPTPPPSTSPTVTPPCGFTCPPGASGFLPSLDCTGFYSCDDFGNPSEWTICRNGLVFDEINQVCNWDWAVDSCSCVSENGPHSQNDVPVYPPVSLPPDQCNAEQRSTVNMGYYQSWAANRFPNCNPVKPGEIDVDAFAYTHLAFAFAGITWSGELEPYNGDGSFVAQYASFNSLKQSYPKLKTLIAVGGW